MTNTALQELESDPQSRKRFLSMVGGAGATGALGLLLAACGGSDKSSTAGGAAATSTAASTTSSSASDVKSDLEILNYALTLEYLEAEFYKEAGASGQIKDRATLEIAKKFGDSEQQHVDALTATIKKLGGTPATKPTTKFQDVIGAGPKSILATAALVENLGAAAYLGQAPRIKNKEVLAAALSIHTVEARHAAALNKLIGAGFKGDKPLVGSLPDGAFAKPMSMDEVLPLVKPFIAS